MVRICGKNMKKKKDSETKTKKSLKEDSAKKTEKKVINKKKVKESTNGKKNVLKKKNIENELIGRVRHKSNGETKKKKKRRYQEETETETEIETETETETETVTKKETGKEAETETEKESESESESETEKESELETETEKESETKKNKERTKEGEILTDVSKTKRKWIQENFDKNNVFLHFEEATLDVRLRKSLLYIFRFKHPTKIQTYAIPYILKGCDVFINSKTGSGKTLAYLIPSVQKLIKLNINEKEHLRFFYKCIIIAPTDILCLQIYEITQNLCKYLKDLVTVTHNIKKNTIDYSTILISTPQSLCKYIIEIKQKQNVDLLSNLKILIMDEADILYKEDFKKSMNKLKASIPKTLAKKFQVIMASATLKKSVIDQSKLLLHNPVFVKLDGTDIHLGINELDEKWLDNENGNKDEKKEQKTKQEQEQEQEQGQEQEQIQNKEINSITNFKGICIYYSCDDEVTKYIMLYCLLKSQIIPFKSIIFTNTLSNAYSVKIFLTYFNVSALVVNPKHSISIRKNTIDLFHQGKCYFLICPQYEEEIKSQHILEKKKSMKKEKEKKEKEKEKKEKEKEKKEKEKETNEHTMEWDVLEEDEKNKDNIVINNGKQKDSLLNRGMDYKDMNCVINFEMALDRETFLHRIGRTCRLTNEGVVISFINETDPLEKHVLQDIVTNNIAHMEQRFMPNLEIENYRYRVESTVTKCKRDRIRSYMDKENNFLNNTLKKYFNTYFQKNEKNEIIQNSILSINSYPIKKKFFTDLNKNHFLFMNNNTNTEKKHHWNKYTKNESYENSSNAPVKKKKIWKRQERMEKKKRLQYKIHIA